MNSAPLSPETLTECQRLLEADDVAGAGTFLEAHPGLLERIWEMPGSCATPPLASARSVEMADLLIAHGARVEEVGRWWAPGFGLAKVIPSVAESLIGRGAAITPHAAAAMGLTATLRKLLEDDPGLVLAKGGDGAHPLHFAINVDCARLLLDQGAQIDARDEDHASTPAQWRIGDHPEVTRFLLDRGATADIFMAAGLGNLALAERLIRQDPACVTWRIGNQSGPFPGIGFQGRGGTIYQWTLGFNQSPQEIAAKRGHREVFDLMMRHSPPKTRFLVACTLPDRSLAHELATSHPGQMNQLDDEDLQLPAKFCWETNLDPEAVRLMLDLGFPVATPERNHGYSPLHNAAWCGHAGLVSLLLERGHPVNLPDPVYHATPLGFAIHSCLVAKRHPEGEFPRVVRLLLEAGANPGEVTNPTGHEEIDGLLKQYQAR